MPMYEYECKACGKNFELLRSMKQADTDVVCQHCGAPTIQRKLSLFASVSKEGNGAVSDLSSGGSCSSGLCGCGGGSCSF
jgi:putative FmdB family regulatory protein